MNEQLVEQLRQIGLHLNVNRLPYAVPIHVNLVHLTLGLFIVAILFDIAGTLFFIAKPVLKVFSLPALRSSFYTVGWYNAIAAAAITFFTVAFGFFELMLADPVTTERSAWGLGAGTTMVLHGIGGVLLLTCIVTMAVWRGFQRNRWKTRLAAGEATPLDRQVQWSYLAVGVVMFGLLYLHGTLGAQMGDEFGIHNTAAHLLRQGEDPNMIGDRY